MNRHHGIRRSFLCSAAQRNVFVEASEVSKSIVRIIVGTIDMQKGEGGLETVTGEESIFQPTQERRFFPISDVCL